MRRGLSELSVGRPSLGTMTAILGSDTPATGTAETTVADAPEAPRRPSLSPFAAALVVILAATLGRGAYQALRGGRLSPRSPAELSTGEDGASTVRDHPLATRETSR